SKSSVPHGTFHPGAPVGNDLVLRKADFWVGKIAGERHLHDLCKVESMTVAALGDLFAAAEAVGDDPGVSRRAADGWQTLEFADRQRNVIFVGYKAEGARHSAATRRRGLNVQTKAAQKLFLGRHLHDGFLVAMAMEQSCAGKLRQI